MENHRLETRDCTNIPTFNEIQFTAIEESSSAITQTQSGLPQRQEFTVRYGLITTIAIQFLAFKLIRSLAFPQIISPQNKEFRTQKFRDCLKLLFLTIFMFNFSEPLSGGPGGKDREASNKTLHPQIEIHYLSLLPIIVFYHHTLHSLFQQLSIYLVDKYQN